MKFCVRFVLFGNTNYSSGRTSIFSCNELCTSCRTLIWNKCHIIFSTQCCGFDSSTDSVVTGTLRRVHEAEDVELVEGREPDEEQVPDHEDDAVALVQLPAVGVGGEHEEHDGGEQRESRVGQTCEQFQVLKSKYETLNSLLKMEIDND